MNSPFLDHDIVEDPHKLIDVVRILFGSWEANLQETLNERNYKSNAEK